MANDSQRDKARATFGKTFFENSKALPNPKNEAAALQKRANDRPIPTYKVGGAVKKATPPQPTAAEREADRKRRESLANTKVTQKEANALSRGMRYEGPGYKDGGKAEQDFTGLMKKAAARAAAKGTPVMKEGGATNEYTAKRVMSRIKAGNFKDGGRAEVLRDRRMKDIEKDYKIALAKGKNEGVAKAKYEQRKADAADDYAKRTNADRTKTSAAEKAAEAALKEARRTKGMSITKRDMAADLAKISIPAKAAAPAAAPAAETPKAKPKSTREEFNAAFSAARAKALKEGRDPNKETFMFGGEKKVARMSGTGTGTGRTVTPARAPAAAAPAAATAPAAALSAFATPALLARNAFGDTTAARLKKEAAERTAKAAADEAARKSRYQGRGMISVQDPQAAKKAATTTAPITAEERRKRDAAYLSTKLAKGGKVEKLAAGGAGKVRKGMMKGK